MNLDLSRSIMVGDKPSDLEVAPVVGARSVLVLTGYGRGEWEYQQDRFRVRPDYVAPDLFDAVEWALKAQIR
jgi:D-glycero-D-manno-heptose 1,7-bisphosphate phosphatase